MARGLPRAEHRARRAGPGSSRPTREFAERHRPSDGANFTSDQADVVEIGPGRHPDRRAARVRATRTTWPTTETQVYTQLDGRDALAVVLPAYLNSGGVGQVQGVWNFSVTTLQAGKKRAPASAVYQAQSGGLLGWFQALYTAPERQPDRRRDRRPAVQRGRHREHLGQGRQPTAARRASTSRTAARSRRTSSSRRAAASSFELSSKSVPINDKLEVAYPKLAKGTSFDMGVGVADLAGNFSTAFVDRDGPMTATTHHHAAPSRTTSQGGHR